MSEPDFDQIRASLQALDDVQARHNDVFHAAQGVYADDPVSPGVMALVWQGKLGDLQIADAVCELPPASAARVINAVVINAFNAWQLDMTRLLQQRPAESV
ncbi:MULTISPECIES: hypothetical protein [Mycobacteriaceae]|uniref:hypothetical protein n=1 Tax=Mycobacteriaceae TaxID=1762 RepID=UPI0009FE7B50|nr:MULTISPECIES: hypothetical protein [Mycobacteriaceae]MBU8841100.1 hypothetical protein [Mycolicibacterium goodii]UCN12885.1 hypothetical protein LFT50_28730 [Mycobacterium intracellulare subsp. chimaera]